MICFSSTVVYQKNKKSYEIVRSNIINLFVRISLIELVFHMKVSHEFVKASYLSSYSLLIVSWVPLQNAYSMCVCQTSTPERFSFSRCSSEKRMVIISVLLSIYITDFLFSYSLPSA